MVINWGDEQRNREARAGVSISRKSQMMKPDKEKAMKTIITVRAVFEDESDADVFVDGLASLEDEGVFPTGADIKRSYSKEFKTGMIKTRPNTPTTISNDAALYGRQEERGNGH